ncbi:hypothetical protein GGP77_001604 [Salinibacter ruber]|nr:hypothetical protein [Salinibacter ruber]
MTDTRQGYKPCSACGRYGSEWVEVEGTLRAVTAPRGVKVEEGERWTCAVCVERGHEQVATSSSSEQETELI